MPAAAAKRRAASRRRSGDALPEIAHASMHRGIATPPNDHAAARSSRRSCRGLFRTHSYPQILLKTLKKAVHGDPVRHRTCASQARQQRHCASIQESWLASRLNSRSRIRAGLPVPRSQHRVSEGHDANPVRHGICALSTGYWRQIAVSCALVLTALSCPAWPRAGCARSVIGMCRD